MQIDAFRITKYLLLFVQLLCVNTGNIVSGADLPKQRIGSHALSRAMLAARGKAASRFDMLQKKFSFRCEEDFFCASDKKCVI